MKKNKFIYRRQFIFGPKKHLKNNIWEKIDLNDEYVICVNKDLNFTQYHDNKNNIILLGYILDPFNPEYDDLAVIKSCLKSINKIDDIFEFLKDKCGRYVIIINFNNDIRMFHDTGGSRQIFYHIDKSNYIWCASQPNLIADYFNYKINIQVENDFKKTRLFKVSDYWYPGTVTLYNNIYHLIPNHYIDLKIKKCFRYWPTNKLNRLSINECIEKNSRLLKGIFLSASKRFKLAFAISSGLDSRLLLAASKDVAKKIHYFTHSNTKEFLKNIEVKNIYRLLKKLKLKHSIILQQKKMDKDFYNGFNKSILTAREIKGLNAFSIYKYFDLDNNNIVVVYGNMAEITKRDRYRYPQIPQVFINKVILTDMAHMSGSKYALIEFEKWLNSVIFFKKYNINILDLMHWEQRVGCWGAMTFSEYDIAFDTLCPYNCRLFIENMLSVPFKYRTKPNYKIQYNIINYLWPDTLQQPINQETNKIKKVFFDFLYILKIYDILKYLYILFFRRYKYDK